jgi:hypothetical protein
LSTDAAPAKRVRQPILYAEQMWRQQRFFAAFLLAVGVVMSGLLLYQHALKSSNLIWLLYIPSGLLLGGAFLYYRWRSFVEPESSGVKVSTLFSSVIIDYNSIRGVKVQPLSLAFQDARKRMVAPVIKPLLEKPALFIRLRGETEDVAAITKSLGRRLAYEDVVALPVRDADAVAWEINSRLPDRLGQNLGGGRRRKRRR